MLLYETKTPGEANREEIFFDRNTNKMSYKDKNGIIVPFAPTSEFQLKGENFTTILANGTDRFQNGNNVIAAYNKALTTTPYGNIIDANNQFYILLAPGYYSFNTDFLVTTNYINIVSLTGLRDVFIIGSNTISVTASKVYIQGIDTGILPFKTSSGGGSQIIENCKGGDYSFGYTGGAYGTYINCVGGFASFGGNTVAAGTFKNCEAQALSFGGGYNSTSATGVFKNCVAGSESFGGFNGTASGTFDACSGGNNSFGSGISGNASGIFTFCSIQGGSFPTPSGSGKFIYCYDSANPYNAGFIPQNKL